jgi:hypothetical protein
MQPARTQHSETQAAQGAKRERSMTRIQTHVTPSSRPNQIEELDDTQLQEVVGGADRVLIAAGPVKREPIAAGPNAWERWIATYF